MPAIGYVRCPFAGADAASHRRGDQAVVSQAKNDGAVSYRCPWCGHSGFGPAGSRNKAHLLAIVERDVEDMPPAAPAAPPKPPKKTPDPKPSKEPPAAPKPGGFSLESL